MGLGGFLSDHNYVEAAHVQVTDVLILFVQGMRRKAFHHLFLPVLLLTAIAPVKAAIRDQILKANNEHIRWVLNVRQQPRLQVNLLFINWLFAIDIPRCNMNVESIELRIFVNIFGQFGFHKLSLFA